jgi:hypothetical protein
MSEYSFKRDSLRREEATQKEIVNKNRTTASVVLTMIAKGLNNNFNSGSRNVAPVAKIEERKVIMVDELRREEFYDFIKRQQYEKFEKNNSSSLGVVEGSSDITAALIQRATKLGPDGQRLAELENQAFKFPNGARVKVEITGDPETDYLNNVYFRAAQLFYDSKNKKDFKEETASGSNQKLWWRNWGKSIKETDLDPSKVTAESYMNAANEALLQSDMRVMGTTIYFGGNSMSPKEQYDSYVEQAAIYNSKKNEHAKICRINAGGRPENLDKLANSKMLMAVQLEIGLEGIFQYYLNSLGAQSQDQTDWETVKRAIKLTINDLRTRGVAIVNPFYDVLRGWTGDKENGLNRAGKYLIKELLEQGFKIDLAHSPHNVMYQIVDIAEDEGKLTNVAYTHGSTEKDIVKVENEHFRKRVQRALPMDLLERMAKAGCVISITALRTFVKDLKEHFKSRDEMLSKYPDVINIISSDSGGTPLDELFDNMWTHSFIASTNHDWYQKNFRNNDEVREYMWKRFARWLLDIK